MGGGGDMYKYNEINVTDNSKIQGLPGVGVFRGKPRFDPGGVKTPADPAGVGVKISSGVKSPPGWG